MDDTLQQHLAAFPQEGPNLGRSEKGIKTYISGGVGGANVVPEARLVIRPDTERLFVWARRVAAVDIGTGKSLGLTGHVLVGGGCRLHRGEAGGEDQENGADGVHFDCESRAGDEINDFGWSFSSLVATETIVPSEWDRC